MEKYTLKNPIDFNGKTYTEIEMDLNNLSRHDFEQCERKVRKQLKRGEIVQTIEGDKRYAVALVAKASKLPDLFFEELRGADYVRLCMLVLSFLMTGEWDTDEEEDAVTTTPTPTKTKASTS